MKYLQNLTKNKIAILLICAGLAIGIIIMSISSVHIKTKNTDFESGRLLNEVK